MKKKKKPLTLIEIMVVIALIGIIGSVLGVNMKKSMDKAKVFKTKAHIQKVEDALNIYYAENNLSPEDVITKVNSILVDSGLFKEDKDLLKDAFGKPLIVQFENGSFICQRQQD